MYVCIYFYIIFLYYYTYLIYLISVDVLKKRWTSLRDCYRKALIKRKTKSGQATSSTKLWKYEQQMSFLKTHFGDKRPQTSNLPNTNQILNDPENVDDSEIIDSPNIENKQHVDIESDDNNGDDAQINSLNSVSTNKRKLSFTGYTHSPNIKKNKCSEYPTSAALVLKTYLDDKKSKKERSSDHLTSFFKSMEDTVRTFSPMRQIEIKSKISALVTEYEIKNITQVYPQHVFSSQYSYSPSLYELYGHTAI